MKTLLTFLLYGRNKQQVWSLTYQHRGSLFSQIYLLIWVIWETEQKMPMSPVKNSPKYIWTKCHQSSPNLHLGQIDRHKCTVIITVSCQHTMNKRCLSKLTPTAYVNKMLVDFRWCISQKKDFQRWGNSQGIWYAVKKRKMGSSILETKFADLTEMNSDIH
jgi:hypothetical protein